MLGLQVCQVWLIHTRIAGDLGLGTGLTEELGKLPCYDTVPVGQCENQAVGNPGEAELQCPLS